MPNLAFTLFHAQWTQEIVRHLPGDWTGEAITTTDDLSRHSGSVPAVVVLSWPELALGTDIARHVTFADDLERIGVPIIWVLHNLTPHSVGRIPWPPYEFWADRADGVVHLSEWGRRRFAEVYRLPSGKPSCVALHGPWSRSRFPFHLDRDDVRASLGIDQRICLGLLGANRSSRRPEFIIDALRTSGREDIRLLDASGALAHVDDQRIISIHGRSSAAQYDSLRSAVDLFVFPVDPDAQLATGVVADALAVGKGALTSRWEFVREHLAGGAVEFDLDDVGSLAGLLTTIDTTTVSGLGAQVAEQAGTTTWAKGASAIAGVAESLLN